MGHIELNDSVSSRRIRVVELNGVVRIDVTEDRPHVVVSEDAVVERLPSEASDDAEGNTV